MKVTLLEEMRDVREKVLAMFNFALAEHLRMPYDDRTSAHCNIVVNSIAVQPTGTTFDHFHVNVHFSNGYVFGTDTCSFVVKINANTRSERTFVLNAHRAEILPTRTPNEVMQLIGQQFLLPLPQ